MTHDEQAHGGDDGGHLGRTKPKIRLADALLAHMEVGLKLWMKKCSPCAHTTAVPRQTSLPESISGWRKPLRANVMDIPDAPSFA